MSLHPVPKHLHALIDRMQVKWGTSFREDFEVTLVLSVLAVLGLKLVEDSRPGKVGRAEVHPLSVRPTSFELSADASSFDIILHSPIFLPT